MNNKQQQKEIKKLKKELNFYRATTHSDEKYTNIIDELNKKYTTTKETLDKTITKLTNENKKLKEELEDVDIKLKLSEKHNTSMMNFYSRQSLKYDIEIHDTEIRHSVETFKLRDRIGQLQEIKCDFSRIVDKMRDIEQIRAGKGHVCGICCENINGNSYIYNLECGHRFDSVCLLMLVMKLYINTDDDEMSVYCPICKRNIIDN